ncbi:MAG: nicotinate-nucleotide--dimethylbenzimidazole phosphoribosyltransferase [Spirochaetales bacterium]|nr:nicotinate-nucleotide--dimethylbenzimidazole phosphoribosyltransferase [Spirochaetales bacterium]
MNKVTATINSIQGLSKESMEKARSRQNQLTKPAGSLGILEDLSVKIAGITGKHRPRLDHKAVFIFAGDHGVVKEGVSAYPAEVTAQMVYNFLNKGAAINVLSRHIGARVIVVDAGVATNLTVHNDLVIRKIGYGTNNITNDCAMTEEQADESLILGIEMIEQECKKGLDIAALGEMGIGNTTPSAAIASVMTGLPVEKVTGKGTGINDNQRDHKISIIKKAIDFHKPYLSDGLAILMRLGGFEIGAIAGAVLGAAAHHIPVVIDGFISTAGALIAHSICPGVSPYIIASHVSAETGHAAMLSQLNAAPLFDLHMRLGEGTGAALAMNIADAACKLLDQMATFEEAGVSDKE